MVLITSYNALVTGANLVTNVHITTGGTTLHGIVFLQKTMVHLWDFISEYPGKNGINLWDSLGLGLVHGVNLLIPSMT